MEIEFQGTMQSSSPLFDAATGQMTNTMVLNTAPVRYSIHAGYTTSGTIAIDETSLTPPLDPTRYSTDPARTVKIRGGRIDARDAQSNPLYTGGPGLPSFFGDSGTGEFDMTQSLKLSSIPQVGSSSSKRGGTETLVNVAQAPGIVTLTYAVTPSVGGGVGNVKRTYALRPEIIDAPIGELVLTKVEMPLSDAVGGTQVDGTMIVRFSALTWTRNTVKENARALTSDATIWGAPVSAREPFTPYCAPGDPDCQAEGPSTGGTTSTNGNGCTFDPEGANVVYVHGIISNGANWGSPGDTNGKVRGRTRCALKIAFDDAPTLTNGGLDGTGTHLQQATQLQALTQSMNRSDLVLVGHSQGGLISRRVAQSYAASGNSGRIRAVVTTGTPHLGANIAKTLSPKSGLDRMVSQSQNFAPCQIGACFGLSESLIALRDGFLGQIANSPAMADLRPGSPAISQVNSVSEGFARYGIQHYIDKRWAFARIGGDSRPENWGTRAVSVIDVLMIGAGAGTVFCIFTGRWGTAYALARFMGAVWSTDTWWNRITAGNDRSDGMVQGLSQVYPTSPGSPLAPIQFAAIHATSHSGEADTPRGYEAIYTVLSERVGIERRAN